MESSVMQQYILALDQGTTSSRAILFDHQGSVLTMAQKEFRQYFPRPGWVEHDPQEIWSTQLGVAAEAVTKAGLTTQHIMGIGITNQRETTIVWDRNSGVPVYPAIVWQDRRTAEYCDQLKGEGHASLIRGKTGLVIDAYFSATKIRWILDNVPGARQKAERGDLAFGTVDTWLAWNLTKGMLHVTDVTNASRTLLFNIHKGAWDEDLLKIFDIPASLLPEVRSSSEIYGHTKHILTGESIPIAGIAGDQQAALFGQQCIYEGMVKNTYGTGCFMLMNTGEKPVESKNNLLTTIAWKINGKTQYALEGSVFVGGAVVQWMRDGMGSIRSAREIEELAMQVADTDGVYMVPAFSGLGAPYWEQHAKGCLFGMTRGTTKSHIARAALESIAFQTMDVLKAMEADANMPIRELRVDGGASANNLLMQFQSDILNVKVSRPRITETTALGAAYLAGLAVGFWSGAEQIQRQWQIEKEFIPSMEPSGRDRKQQEWKRAVEALIYWSRS